MSQSADPTIAGERRARPRRGARRWLLALASLLVGFAAAEAGARAFFPGADAFYIYPPDLRRTFLPMVKIMPGIEPEVHFDVNSLGYRGDEPPQGPAYRILALGGSTTQCAYVDQPDAWPMRVQALLNESGGAADGRPVWVANAGRSGFTTRRHAVQLRHLLEQEPRFDAVLLLAGVNDLAQRLEYGDLEPPPEELTFEGVSTSDCFTFVPPEHDDTSPLLERLGLFRMAKVIQVRISMPEREQVGKDCLVWRRNRRNASEIREELPDLALALRCYQKNLAECAALCREHGVRLILVDQPSIWRDDLPESVRQILWLGGVGNYQNQRGLPYYSIAALAEGMRRYNAALHEVAAKLGIESIELAARIPKDAQHFYDDVHFNDRGSRAVGEAIAAYLRERPPFAE
jgi:lysophospholipase L1-like esterase